MASDFAQPTIEMPPAKRMKVGTLQPSPEDLDEGVPVVYDGERCGLVRDAYIPLDEFWVTDLETGEMVRNADGEINTFKSKDLALCCASLSEPVPATGIKASGILLIGHEEHMIKILEHCGEPFTDERRRPQQLLAIPVSHCGPELLKSAATTGIADEMLEFGRQLRSDINVGVRVQALKRLVEQFGESLATLQVGRAVDFLARSAWAFQRPPPLSQEAQGLYLLAAVRMPFPPEACEAADLGHIERVWRRDCANQIDLTATATCRCDVLEDSSSAARSALSDSCSVKLASSLCSEAVQQAVRAQMQVPNLPRVVKDSGGLEVLVVLLPADVRVQLSRGVLRFRAPQVAGGGEEDEDKDEQGNDRRKTVREWEAEQQREFGRVPRLPPGWLRARSRETGDVYFFNKVTKEASFDPPEPPLPPGWTTQVSRTTGKVYYWHQDRRVSTFDRPTA